MAGLFGSRKKDERPVDVGLAALHGKGDAEAMEWWKQRLGLIAAIPSETGRVGALVPQLRELARIVDRGERARLTRARMTAMVALPPEQQEPIISARRAAYSVDRALVEDDQRLVDELIPTVPGARELQGKMEQRP